MSIQRTIDNMRLIASTWTDELHTRKRETLEGFALELERMAISDAIDIADESSAMFIECNAHVHDSLGHAWRDLASVEPIDRESIDKAVRYLTARGLLVRHPEQEGWVRVREQG